MENLLITFHIVIIGLLVRIRTTVAFVLSYGASLKSTDLVYLYENKS